MHKHDVLTEWVTEFTDANERSIVELVDFATADGGSLGFVSPMNAAEALEAVDTTCRLFYTMCDEMYQSFCKPLAQQLVRVA